MRRCLLRNSLGMQMRHSHLLLRRAVMKYVSLIGALVIFTAGCSITPTASVEGKESQTKKVLIVTGI